MGILNYSLAVPFEPWMQEASLEIEEDLCGCGEQTKLARTHLFDGLTKDVIAEPVYRVRPQLVYIQPEVEPIKRRQQIENAYLEFPRGDNVILPDFGNNPVELARIDKMIRTIATNKDITVQRVYMVGYASPESSVKFNTDLSRARSEAMMRYFMNNSTIPANLYEARTGGEDWNGFRAALEDFPLANKEEIFHIMNTVGNLDEREHAISKVAGGRPYKIIFDEIYPKLRRTVCEINFTVKDFSLEEAKENMAIAPHLLSLNEMYIVANTYEVGSPAFLNVFEVARQEFPKDPVANLNGAAAALAKNNVRDAERFLKLSDPSTPEYANNMGVYYLLTGNYREAERYLKRAESLGVRVASFNLKELAKKVANVNNRREAGVDENSDDRPASSGSSRRRVQ
jgi:tetratricopeptide (TPR) repeat protein